MLEKLKGRGEPLRAGGGRPSAIDFLHVESGAYRDLMGLVHWPKEPPTKPMGLEGVQLKQPLRARSPQLPPMPPPPTAPPRALERGAAAGHG